MKIMFLSQVLNGMVLPFVLIVMLLLINDKKLMGSYVNGPIFNLIAQTTVVIMVILTIIMTLDIALPGILNRLLGH
jgi:Mn2+/Fe2+ NRAMP family transporter